MSASIDMHDVKQCSDENLRRMLEFALDHDPFGLRMRQTPPKNRAEIIQQLCWLGIIETRAPGRGTGYY